MAAEVERLRIFTDVFVLPEGQEYEDIRDQFVQQLAYAHAVLTSPGSNNADYNRARRQLNDIRRVVEQRRIEGQDGDRSIDRSALHRAIFMAQSRVGFIDCRCCGFGLAGDCECYPVFPPVGNAAWFEIFASYCFGFGSTVPFDPFPRWGRDDTGLGSEWIQWGGPAVGHPGHTSPAASTVIVADGDWRTGTRWAPTVAFREVHDLLRDAIVVRDNLEHSAHQVWDPAARAQRQAAVNGMADALNGLVVRFDALSSPGASPFISIGYRAATFGSVVTPGAVVTSGITRRLVATTQAIEMAPIQLHVSNTRFVYGSQFRPPRMPATPTPTDDPFIEWRVVSSRAGGVGNIVATPALPAFVDIAITATGQAEFGVGPGSFETTFTFSVNGGTALTLPLTSNELTREEADALILATPFYVQLFYTYVDDGNNANWIAGPGLVAASNVFQINVVDN
jgi:hypothetical protein